MFNPGDEVRHLKPTTPVHREKMNAPHIEVHGCRLVLLFCQDHAIQVLQETLATGNLAILCGVLGKPQLQKPTDCE